jgi:transposase-like protein
MEEDRAKRVECTPKVRHEKWGQVLYRRAMSKKAIRLFSREFKLRVVHRMLAGENVSALAREIKVLRKDLYVWRDRFRSGGPEALRDRGRPRNTAPVRAA